jgi:murein DD-endopeptidase MepM/ murein hydrolase activator NlpD
MSLRPRTLVLIAASLALSAVACVGTVRYPYVAERDGLRAGGSRVEVTPLQRAGAAARPAAPPAQPARLAHFSPTGPSSSSVRYEPLPAAGVTAYTQPTPALRSEASAGRAAASHRAKDGHAREPRQAAPTSAGDIYGPRFTPDGVAFPYPADKVFRGFGRCIGGHRHHHEAIDLGGVGPDWGVGTPIRSMGRAEVVFIGLGRDNPELFGAPDTRKGKVTRGRRELPRHAVIAPYGDVWFFTRTKGRWRSGNLVVTRVVDGPLKGHIIRYLHVAAVHPALAPGVIVEAGQEIALMGGTGVQESAPHLHLDIEAPDGHRVDVAPVLGLAPTASCEDVPTGLGDTSLAAASEPVARKYRRLDAVTRSAASSDKAERGDDEDAGDVGRVWLKRLEHRCEGLSWREDFRTGRYDGHALVMRLSRGDRIDVSLKKDGGKWLPVLDHDGAHLKKKRGRARRGEQRLVLEAEDDTEVTLKIEARGGGQPPKDAGYALSFAATCKGARRGR